MSPSHTGVTEPLGGPAGPGDPRGPVGPSGAPCRPAVGDTAACEIRDLLDRLAGKWALLVVELLGHGTRRFTELRSTIDGISQRMLTLTLRQLERDGLVSRTVHPVVPPRVDYALTPLGESLLDSIQPLVGWTREHRDEIAAARAAHDARTAREPGGPAEL